MVQLEIETANPSVEIFDIFVYVGFGQRVHEVFADIDHPVSCQLLLVKRHDLHKSRAERLNGLNNAMLIARKVLKQEG